MLKGYTLVLVQALGNFNTKENGNVKESGTNHFLQCLIHSSTEEQKRLLAIVNDQNWFCCPSGGVCTM